MNLCMLHVTVAQSSSDISGIHYVVAVLRMTPSFYPHMQIGSMWIYWLLFVCLFVCKFVFVWLRISPASIKLTASYFARWLIGVLGRESPILVNFV